MYHGYCTYVQYSTVYMCTCVHVCLSYSNYRCVHSTCAQHLMRSYVPFLMQMTVMVAMAVTPKITGTTVHSTITSTSSVLVRSGPGVPGGRVSGGEWEKGTGCIQWHDLKWLYAKLMLLMVVRVVTHGPNRLEVALQSQGYYEMERKKGTCWSYSYTIAHIETCSFSESFIVGTIYEQLNMCLLSHSGM